MDIGIAHNTGGLIGTNENYNTDPVYNFWYSNDLAYNFGFGTTTTQLESDLTKAQQKARLSDLMTENIGADNIERSMEQYYRQTATPQQGVTNKLAYTRRIGGGENAYQPGGGRCARGGRRRGLSMKLQPKKVTM